MRSLEIVCGTLVVAGLVLALVYPNETIGFARSIVDSIRWMHHEAVPRNM